MLDILANTYLSATRSDRARNAHPNKSNDTARRNPWRGIRWGNRRDTRNQIRRMHGMSDEMLNDIGIARGNIDRLFD